MKRASLVAAIAVVVMANAFALVHAWRNRTGPVDSDVTLTGRELMLYYQMNEENSGVALNLRWIDPQGDQYQRSPWLDQRLLQDVGFDTHIAPSDKAASEFYQRQRPRRAFVALEYDGPAWQAWKNDQERKAEETLSRFPAYKYPPSQYDTASRLVTIDASNDATRLRSRHPDRASVVIVPAVIRIGVELEGATRPARLSGWIQEIPSWIHVPLPFSDAFRRRRAEQRVKYRVHLRYGPLLEPWIVGVDLP